MRLPARDLLNIAIDLCGHRSDCGPFGRSTAFARIRAADLRPGSRTGRDFLLRCNLSWTELLGLGPYTAVRLLNPSEFCARLIVSQTRRRPHNPATQHGYSRSRGACPFASDRRTCGTSIIQRPLRRDDLGRSRAIAIPSIA